jgi:hypothetical protein
MSEEKDEFDFEKQRIDWLIRVIAGIDASGDRRCGRDT